MARHSTKMVAFSIVAILASATQTTAKDLFRADVTVAGQTQGLAFDNISDFATTDYRNINLNYTDTSAANANLFIRGVASQASFAANDPALNFSIPSLGINERFAGATRKQSQQLFEDWLKSNSGRLLKEFTKSTAIDPIAGNPNSLMSKMAEADFGMATQITGGTSGRAANVTGLEAEYGNFKSGGYKGSSYNLPLSQTFGLGDSGKSLILSVPLQYTDTEGAKSYAGGIGAGLRFPINDHWSLTPALRAGVAGSEDLGAGSIMYSGSLTSVYETPWQGYDFKLGNMIAYYQSQALNIGDIDLDYDLKNLVFRNGLSVSHALPFMKESKLRGQAFVINTEFTGSDLYISNYTDVGIAVGMPVTVGSTTYDKLALGVSYSFADDYDAVKVNLGFNF